MTYGTSEIQSHWAWRLPFLLQMVPALMVGLGIHVFPAGLEFRNLLLQLLAPIFPRAFTLSECDLG